MREDLLFFARQAETLEDVTKVEEEFKPQQKAYKADSLFSGIAGGYEPLEDEQLAPVSSQLAKTFMEIENVKTDTNGANLVKGAFDIDDTYTLQMFQSELGTSSSKIKVMPLSTNAKGERFTEDKDYGSKMKSHLDYLRSKYNIVVVPREVTGFSTYSVSPDEYTPVKIHEKYMYSSSGIHQMNELELAIDMLKEDLALKGTAKMSLLKAFKSGIKDVGITHTLAFTLDEIAFLAETFAGYSPCLVETADDYILMINPTTVPLEMS